MASWTETRQRRSSISRTSLRRWRYHSCWCRTALAQQLSNSGSGSGSRGSGSGSRGSGSGSGARGSGAGCGATGHGGGTGADGVVAAVCTVPQASSFEAFPTPATPLRAIARHRKMRTAWPRKNGSWRCCRCRSTTR
eukprot:1223233-Prymnesium_polylepis.1